MTRPISNPQSIHCSQTRLSAETAEIVIRVNAAVSRPTSEPDRQYRPGCVLPTRLRRTEIEKGKQGTKKCGFSTISAPDEKALHEYAKMFRCDSACLSVMRVGRRLLLTICSADAGLTVDFNQTALKSHAAAS